MQENRSRTMAPVVAAWGVGFAAGPALGGLLAEAFGTQMPFYGQYEQAYVLALFSSVYVRIRVKVYRNQREFLKNFHIVTNTYS